MSNQTDPEQAINPRSRATVFNRICRFLARNPTLMDGFTHEEIFKFDEEQRAAPIIERKPASVVHLNVFDGGKLTREQTELRPAR